MDACLYVSPAVDWPPAPCVPHLFAPASLWPWQISDLGNGIKSKIIIRKEFGDL